MRVEKIHKDLFLRPPCICVRISYVFKD